MRLYTIAVEVFRGDDLLTRVWVDPACTSISAGRSRSPRLEICHVESCTCGAFPLTRREIMTDHNDPFGNHNIDELHRRTAGQMTPSPEQVNARLAAVLKENPSLKYSVKWIGSESVYLVRLRSALDTTEATNADLVRATHEALVGVGA